MATEEEIMIVAEKVVRDCRNNNTNLENCSEVRKYRSSFTQEEGKKIISSINQIISVIWHIKRRFPYGRISKDFVIQKTLYDKDYFAFKIAVKIINDEERGSPLSQYVHVEDERKIYPEIDYSRYYTGSIREFLKDLRGMAKTEIDKMKITGEEVRFIQSKKDEYEGYYVTTRERECKCYEYPIEVDSVKYFIRRDID